MRIPPVRHRAFTLIELLVVVSILAILTVLAASTIPAVMERARMTQCVSNLRQVGALVLQVSADQGGVPWYDRSQGGFNGMWWHQLYKGSGMSPEAFSELISCPSARRDQRSRSIRLSSTETVEISYRYNKRLGYNTGAGYIPNYLLKRLSNLKEPGIVPIVADTSTAITDNVPGFDEWVHVYSAHSKGQSGNVLFLDGHVEAIRKPAEGQSVANEDSYDLKVRQL